MKRALGANLSVWREVALAFLGGALVAGIWGAFWLDVMRQVFE